VVIENVIIGVHGLLNKPAKEILEPWWKSAIEEGLLVHHGSSAPFSFKLVYWANVRNSTPLATVGVKEPYEKSEDKLHRYRAKRFDKVRGLLGKYVGKYLDKKKAAGESSGNLENLIKAKVGDLGDYYHNEQIRQAIRNSLIEVLDACKGRNILLLGHSMGAIIAYDVFRLIENNEDIKIDNFVTLGSPLGLPSVSAKVRDEFEECRTPKNVNKWININDPQDKIALDCYLADEYRSYNNIRVKDVLVNNQYISPIGKANNHKSFGYLRCPEMSDLIHDFLK